MEQMLQVFFKGILLLAFKLQPKLDAFKPKWDLFRILFLITGEIDLHEAYKNINILWLPNLLWLIC